MISSENNAQVDVAAITVMWRQTGGMPHQLHKRSDKTPAQLLIRSIAVLNEVRQGGRAEEVVGDCDGDGHLMLWTGGNLGYGCANNVGVEWARRLWSPRYFLVLNPDVVIDQTALERLVAKADADPELGILGPLQQVRSGSKQVLRRGMRYFKPLSILRPVISSGYQIDYLNGGALLIRASALMNEPPFADDYFLFFEELEICERLRRGGYQIAACEESCVIHHEGGSRGSHHDDYVPEVTEYFENLNALRFTRRNCPWWLPSVLLMRLIAKPAVLIIRRDFLRLRFWWLAVKDFICFRVRRFPFQAGWNPALTRESLIDSAWPDFAKVRRG